MPIVTHPFVSAVPDDPTAVAAGEVVPSNWNASHSLVYKIVTSISGSSSTMASNEDIREINVSAPFAITLPTSPVAGKTYIVVDISGNASSNNITINPISYVIGSNNGAWTGYFSSSLAAWVQTA